MSKKYLTVIPMLILCLLASCLAQPGGVITDSCTVSAIPGVDEFSSESSENTSAESSKSPDSSVPTDSSRSISPASSENTSSSGATEWWQKELTKNALVGEDDSDPYLLRCTTYRNSDMVGTSMMDAVFPSLIGDSSDFPFVFESAKETNELGEKLTDVSFIEFLMSDDTKYTMTFYEKGIALTKAFPGENTGEPVLLAIDDKDYQTILATAKKSLKADFLYPTWISIIRESRCDSINVSSPDGSASTTYIKDDMLYFDTVFGSIRNIEIQPGTSQYVEKSTILPDSYKIEMIFSTGVIYQIQCNDSTILIASSDIDKAIQYSLTAPDTTHLELLATRDFIPNTAIPNTAKPVIYLYPETETDVSVKVRYKGEFTCTYPTYNDGWEVTAYPDGRLINHADGTEYYYLFWEGNYRKEWNFDEGFVIKGEETEAFLQKALSTLGLTPREYNDFIVYWLPEMQLNPYNLITFATDEYEDIAPLEISPKPDSILRVHMVYKALSKPVEIRPQTLTSFTRQGFTVVEWGGTRAK